MDKNLESQASDPKTPAVELQRLAGEYPSLRPLIAMNPSTYPELLEWLGNLHDPAVNLALQQRRAAETAKLDSSAGATPRRVSVIQRSENQGATSRIPVTPTPATAPAQADSGGVAVAEEPKRTMQKWIWVVLAVILIGAAIALIMNLRSGNEPGDVATPPTVEQEESAGVQQPEQQSEEEEEPQSEGTGEREPDPDATYPAPDNAIWAETIASPSNNIVCKLSDDGVACTISSHILDQAGVTGCSSQPATIQTTSGLPEIGCSATPVSNEGAVTLSQGAYATYGHGACLVDDSSMSCWDTHNGSAFAIDRMGYMIRMGGKIEPSDFLWKSS